MVQKFTSECPLLEDLSFFSCWGIKYFCISKPLNLKALRIKEPFEDDCIESIKIVVPSLQQFVLLLDGPRIEPFVIDMSGCLNLSDLELMGDFFKDQEFHNFISKFSLLEKLVLHFCGSLEKIVISSNQLKELSIKHCVSLKAVDVDTPNLLSFAYLFNPVPIFSVNAPYPWRIAFIYQDVGASWYINVKEFLRASNQIYNLFIHDWSSRTTFTLEDFQNYPPSPPCGVESLTLFTPALPSRYAALLDGIFWICYPKLLCVDSVGEDKNNFIKWLCRELRNEYVYCCNSLHIKCWRHYLKDFVVKSSLMKEDDEPMDIYKLLDELSAHPNEKLRFYLEWSFPEYASIDIGSY